MLWWTRLSTVNVWRRTTSCAKTTESEREAEDQIMEQVNKYTRNGGRREMLSVKMHLAKTTTWNQVRSGDDAEKLVSNEVKETLAEATQLLENVSRTIEQVILDLRNTQKAKGGASNQRKARGAGEATGAQQREREG